jgi:hypothetical protein
MARLVSPTLYRFGRSSEILINENGEGPGVRLRKVKA